MGSSADDEARVAAVDAGQGVAEADGDPAGDAGGQEEDPALAAAGRELACAQCGDGGFPVSAGEQSDAVAELVPMVMKRLGKASRCSQLPQSISTPVPCSRWW